jgi:DNA-binding transcriptional LysR family regulator
MTLHVVPNFRQLAAFDAVVRTESLSRAAAEIGRSQPALTQTIAKLEREFGAVMFKRKNTGCYMTEAGSILHRRAGRLFAQIDQALAEFGVTPLRSGRGDLRFLATITPPQVRCFLAIVDNGSFASAAKALGISEASLHRAARDLERNLGRPLFRRTATGLTATRTAAELARRIRLAIHEVELAVDELRTAEGISNSLINIGTLPLAGASFLARVLKDLTEYAPGTRVVISEGPYDNLLQGLRVGAIDFIIGPLRYPDPALGVVEQALFHDTYSIVVRPNHPLTCVKKVNLRVLARYDWIVPPPGVPRRIAFDQLFLTARQKPHSSFQTSSLELTRAILSETDRVTLLSRHEAESAEKMGILTSIKFNVNNIGRVVQVTTRTDWLPTGVQLRFLELLREHARQINPRRSLGWETRQIAVR